jgi:hypothetical protein
LEQIPLPIYKYLCCACNEYVDQRRSVDDRDAEHRHDCETFGNKLWRIFTPTANIVTPEHFRHLQSDFLPAAGDTEAWAARGNASQSHVATKKDDSREFEEFVRRDMAQQGGGL